MAVGNVSGVMISILWYKERHRIFVLRVSNAAFRHLGITGGTDVLYHVRLGTGVPWLPWGGILKYGGGCAVQWRHIMNTVVYIQHGGGISWSSYDAGFSVRGGGGLKYDFGFIIIQTVSNIVWFCNNKISIKEKTKLLLPKNNNTCSKSKLQVWLLINFALRSIKYNFTRNL